MSNYLETIKEQVKELVGQEKYRQLKNSGELDLDEYRDRVAAVRSAAGRQVRKQAEREGWTDERMIQQQNLVAQTAQDQEMEEISAELHNLYGSSTQTDKLPTTSEIRESMRDALNRNVLNDKLTP